jgi:hypothetical protein
MPPVRALADQAFSRAAGAPLIEGNSVRLLKDARENYPAWLDAIGGAERRIHFESYIIHEDEAGQMFADALVARAREGVRVRLICDWMGGLGKTSRAFWKHLRADGIEQAFAQVWAMMGEPIPEHELIGRDALHRAGDVSLRVVASAPATAGLFRLDQLVAALARRRLWLTDAYYAGTTAYLQALRAVAKVALTCGCLCRTGQTFLS